MEFDIRSINSAKKFVSEFTGMTEQEYNIEKFDGVDGFELLWDALFNRIQAINISDLRIVAFHIVGSLDECKEIKENGLEDLQKVLSSDTTLSRELKKVDVQIDIANKLISCDDNSYILNTESSGPLFFVSNRLLNDYCINGFFFNDDIFNYGNMVYKRPEFLMNISELFPKVRSLDELWKRKSKSYKINFYATVEQIAEFTFELSNELDPPYRDWGILSDDMKIKKWLFSHALERARDNLGTEKFLYIKNGVIIPPEQIISIDELNCEE